MKENSYNKLLYKISVNTLVHCMYSACISLQFYSEKSEIYLGNKNTQDWWGVGDVDPAI